MNRKRMLTFFLCLTLQCLAGADNGVDGISDVCVDCLRRVQPDSDQECVPHETKPHVQLCGSFKMSERFYIDCRSYMRAVPEKWNSWEKCYKDDECGQQCVMAYHNHYASTCATAKDSPGEPLICADYGQIHLKGAGSCGQSNSDITEFIQNMTLLCGCETVTGDRMECLRQLESSAAKHGDKATFLIPLIVVSCLAFVFLVISIIAIGLYCIKRQTPNSGGKVAITSTDSLRSGQQAILYNRPAGTVTSEAVQKTLSNYSSAITSQKSPTGSRSEMQLTVPPSPLLKPPTASESSSLVTTPAYGAVQVHNTTEVPVQDNSMQQVSEDYGYINMPTGVSHIKSPSSLAGSTSTLDRVRAPIPIPR